jgi:hypothetical protein
MLILALEDNILMQDISLWYGMLTSGSQVMIVQIINF